ncbi:MAG: 3'-5' exonuclease, partial [Muribaculaceae bacterium]|nr:3'-5' exonuclease [Muribaculaceae bacterium]
IYDDQDRELINFGKYKGRIAEEVLRQDPGYFAWIMKGDFTKNTKDCFTRIRKRINERSER